MLLTLHLQERCVYQVSPTNSILHTNLKRMSKCNILVCLLIFLLGKIGANRKSGRDLTKSWRGLTSPFSNGYFSPQPHHRDSAVESKRKRKTYQVNGEKYSYNEPPPSWQRPIACFFSRSSRGGEAANQND